MQPDAQSRVTFEDVAGIDEAENELVEIVDFLKNPKRYQRLGARIPRGVLLYGAARHGQDAAGPRRRRRGARPPFFSISASEFVEAIVGVGASRVRDLFKQAKEAAPAIIFIDELDAIGRVALGAAAASAAATTSASRRSTRSSPRWTASRPSTNVIVLGATNRQEILDPALLRPGRFDRRIAVQPPDRNGRAEILRIHTRSVPLADSVDLDADRRLDAGHDRRRPRAAGQRGGALRRPPRPRARRAGRTSPTRSRRSSSAPSARCS